MLIYRKICGDYDLPFLSPHVKINSVLKIDFRYKLSSTNDKVYYWSELIIFGQTN